jgi:ketosteroid isomerase-like protein
VKIRTKETVSFNLLRGDRSMRKSLIIMALAVSLTACGSSEDTSSQQAAQKQADMYAIDQIEVKWHKAASAKDVDLVMSLFADDATFNIGPKILAGKEEIRDFFEHDAAPFKPENNWVSDTPAYKIRITVGGDKGTLYFECHYVDPKTKMVVAVVGADQDVARINGRWLITKLAAATPTLSP